MFLWGQITPTNWGRIKAMNGVNFSVFSIRNLDRAIFPLTNFTKNPNYQTCNNRQNHPVKKGLDIFGKTDMDHFI